MAKNLAYILESPLETDRLEQQAQLPAYNLDQEFGDLNLPPQSRVLDAGCGTAVLARYLAQRFPKIQIEGCDLSALRLQQAKKLTSPGASIRYFESSLESIAAPDSSYDEIVCRYVLEHLPDPVAAAREFLRILKPGAYATVCDFDGLMFNLYPMSHHLQKLVQAFLPSIPVDLSIGRKLPTILARAGFENISWKVTATGIQGDALEAEREICAQRIAFSLPYVAKALGSEKEARAFETLYLEEIRAPNAVLFQNKFIVRGRKDNSGS